VIVLGVVLILVGWLEAIPILETLGIVLLVLGVILVAVGTTPYALGGRRHWF
jgi:hypothetical protein